MTESGIVKYVWGEFGDFVTDKFLILRFECLENLLDHRFNSFK